MDLSYPDKPTIIKSVFEKYDSRKKGYLNREEFIFFLVHLGKHVKELDKITDKTAVAVFSLIDKNSDGKINFDEFCSWWNMDVSKRYGYFIGEKKNLLRKSYDLYSKYSTSCSGRKYMTLINFEKMMEDLKIDYSEECFDSLDNDGDGILSFEEFCLWLDWF